MANDGGFIPQHDCWHWQHIWSSPWTKQVGGGLLPATPPNAGFPGNGPPKTTLTSIAGNPQIKVGSHGTGSKTVAENR
jgi:hypothetical protein